MQPVVIVHGGAGPRRVPADAAGDEQRLQALEHAVRTACEHLARGALAACVEAVAELEDCPLFNAGTGSVLASDGAVWCDAAVMSGDGRAGAVAAVTGIRHPVRAARALRDEGETVLWAGHSGALAERFALATIEPDALVTAHARRRLDAHRAAGAQPQTGTVGAVCLDAEGRLAAATSTGGRTGKHPARVGDSPIVGAGTWADARTCAISATGAGEAFIRAACAHEVHARMLHGAHSLHDAATAALAAVRDAGGLGGIICVSHDGQVAMPCSDDHMSRAWRIGNGEIHTAVRSERRD